MVTKKAADEFSYIIPGWYWDKARPTAIRAARALARRKRLDIEDGEPEVHVTLVWPVKAKQSAA